MIIFSIGAVVVVGLVLSRVLRSGRGASGQGRSQDPAAAAPPAPRSQPPVVQPSAPPGVGETGVGESGVGETTVGETGVTRVAPGSAVDPADPSWAEARRLRRLLLDRQVPATISIWEIVPEEGEVFFYDLQALYERYYGQDATYQKAGSFLIGNPAFILAGLAVTGLANASRRRAAEQQAATQWRDQQVVRVVVSNHRLICFIGGQWLSYHYAAMNAVYPQVVERALITGFASIPPLRITGVDAPILAVITVFATHGLEGLEKHPALRRLD